jgi:hypothetical protein
MLSRLGLISLVNKALSHYIKPKNLKGWLS